MSFTFSAFIPSRQTATIAGVTVAVGAATYAAWRYYKSSTKPVVVTAVENKNVDELPGYTATLIKQSDSLRIDTQTGVELERVRASVKPCDDTRTVAADETNKSQSTTDTDDLLYSTVLETD